MSPIDRERWRVLSPYLDEALDLAPEERARWLGGISSRDAALAADLRNMLAEHDAVSRERFLDETVLDPRVAASATLAGQVVGSYRLLSIIGEGGSGSVWLAERADGRFEGRVAVKLLNVWSVGASAEERFRREGTILAGLRHPRIAHLIDAGLSSTRQPYLVLEYVDGQPIDTYCREHALGIDARLRLFLDVLDAVGHAHANLIVHRDLKPANVLVNKDGQVKLLDFGIAKLAQHKSGDESRSFESSTISREVGRAMTPLYAAPEQLAGGSVTTATDIYALGVLLFVLLAREHPAGPEVDSDVALMRSIVVDQPRQMSDAAPDDLRPQLRGDLDAIVRRALQKDPLTRYASVSAFAEDIRRHLEHQPVSARPSTLRYRTGLFIRRHRAGVAAAAAAVLVITALTLLYTRRLEVERDRAEREAAKAQKASALLSSLLTSADPYATRATPGEPTVRALLDSGAERVQKELAGEPELQAEMLTMMGRTYRRLALYDKAQGLLQQALVAGRSAFGNEDVRIAQTLTDLGVVFYEKGEFTRAAQTLEESLAMRRKLLGAHPDVAVTLVELGRVYQDQGDNTRAEPLNREALEMRRQTLGPEDGETAVSLSSLASVLRLNGDLAGAEASLRQSLDVNRKIRGEDHPNTSMTVHDLALIAIARGELQSAESDLTYVLAQQRKSLGVSHPVTAMTLNNLARVQARLGRYDDGASSMESALNIIRPALGRDHQLVAIYSANAAAIQLARNQPAAAETLLREALRIRTLAPGIVPSRRRTLPEDDWSVSSIKSLLGAALTAQGRFVEAESVLQQAHRDLSSTRAADVDLTVNLSRLVDLYTAWGKPAVAAEYRALIATHGAGR